jgi:hypothetical protein
MLRVASLLAAGWTDFVAHVGTRRLPCPRSKKVSFQEIAACCVQNSSVGVNAFLIASRFRPQLLLSNKRPEEKVSPPHAVFIERRRCELLGDRTSGGLQADHD